MKNMIPKTGLSKTDKITNGILKNFNIIKLVNKLSMYLFFFVSRTDAVKSSFSIFFYL